VSIIFRDQYFTFHKILNKYVDMTHPEKSTVRVSLSSSRKKGDTGEREYSDWFASASGETAKAFETLIDRDFIVCNGSMSRVPYNEPDGTRKWPDARMFIFEFKKWVKPEEPEYVAPVQDGHSESKDSPF
jgi:hypothetical protein